jgi:hypothetical protein
MDTLPPLTIAANTEEEIPEPRHRSSVLCSTIPIPSILEPFPLYPSLLALVPQLAQPQLEAGVDTKEIDTKQRAPSVVHQLPHPPHDHYQTPTRKAKPIPPQPLAVNAVPPLPAAVMVKPQRPRQQQPLVPSPMKNVVVALEAVMNP